MYQYVHGGDIYSDPSLKSNKDLLDYSANINPLGIPVGVRRALKDAVAGCVNYPDPFCRELRDRLSRCFSLPAEMIYCGNGAADVLFRIMTALKPKRTLVLAPTFADYEKAALAAGSKMDYFTLKEDNEFAVTPEILKSITKRTELVVLCNPNNPTGKLMNKELLLKVLRHCEELHIPLLVDECFMDFVQDQDNYTLIDQLAGHPGLIILKAITKRTEMVVLCNPNNPTGKLMDKGLLLTVLRHCGELHIPLLVDECFMDFVMDKDKYSLLDQVTGHPGLIILKAFTKIFAIPGVRLGFCLTSDTVMMDKLYACGQDWNVSVLAQAAGVAALDEKDFLVETRELIAIEKAYLITQLRLIGLKVFEGAANYILIKTLHNYPWPQKLKKHHIMIRDCSNYRGLSPGYYRIAVKTRRDNRKLVKIMKELVKHDFFNYIN